MSGHGTDHHDAHAAPVEHPPVAAHAEHADAHAEAHKPETAAHALADSLDFGKQEKPHEGEPTVAEFADALEIALKQIYVPEAHIHAVKEIAAHEKDFAHAMTAASHKLAELHVDFDLDAFCKEKGLYVDAGSAKEVEVAPKKPVDVAEVVGKTQAAIYRAKLGDACLLKLGPDKAKRLKTDNLTGEGTEEQQAYALALTWLEEVFLHEMDKSAIGRAGSEAARKKHELRFAEAAKKKAVDFLAQHAAGVVEA